MVDSSSFLVWCVFLFLERDALYESGLLGMNVLTNEGGVLQLSRATVNDVYCDAVFALGETQMNMASREQGAEQCVVVM